MRAIASSSGPVPTAPGASPRASDRSEQAVLEVHAHVVIADVGRQLSDERCRDLGPQSEHGLAAVPFGTQACHGRRWCELLGHECKRLVAELILVGVAAVTLTETIDRLIARVDRTAADSQPGFPHYADPQSGRWAYSPDGDWTGGFWVGMCWLAAHATGAEQYVELARRYAERLEPRVASDTVFRGFLFWYGATLGALLHDDRRARDLALAGARGLAESYNRAARLLPLGTQAEEASDVGEAEANIDGVPGGTPLLVWAAAELGVGLLRDMALNHAERHIELCVRDDGSVCQSASFDTGTGEVLRRYTHKGIRDDSTWARAQAWGMLGFAQAAAVAPERFAEVALRVSDWWLDHLPQGQIAFWDFDDPAIPHTNIDTSATAIAAAALLKLAVVAPERAERERSAAERMVEALGAHLTPLEEADDRPPGMLLDGCYNRRLDLASRHELIWGDYFLFESALVLAGRLDSARI